MSRIQACASRAIIRPRPHGLRAATAAAFILGSLVPGAAHAATPGVLDATASTAAAATFKPLIVAAGTSGTTRVIVGLRTSFDPTDAASPASSSQAKSRIKTARTALLSALPTSAEVEHTYDSLPYVALKLTAAELKTLQSSGQAASIQLDRQLTAQDTYGPGLIEAPTENTRGYDGTGQIIADPDTGVEETHPDLTGHITSEACFSSFGECPNGTTTQVGAGAADAKNVHVLQPSAHGTAVAGLAVGTSTGTVGGVPTVNGVAPGAKVMPILISSYTSVLESDLLQSLQYVINQRAAGTNVSVVNISQGIDQATTGDCDTVSGQPSPLKAPIDTLRAQGVPTIIAAGNDSRADRVAYPACISSAITVGATDGTDHVPTFSNSSSQVELLAPGANLTVAAFNGAFASNGSGTSYAAPHVAGAWAAYLTAYPGTSVGGVLNAFQNYGKLVTDGRNGVTRTRVDLARAMSRWAFFDANQPTFPSYSNSPYQGNSTGAINSVVRTSAGVYTLNLPNSGSTTRGNVQVREVGTTTNRCVIGAQFGSDASNGGNVNVRCYTTSGTPDDTEFIAEYRANESIRSNKTGYVTSLFGSRANYTPANSLQSDNTGAATATVQRVTTGRYIVTFPNFMGTSGVPSLSVVGNATNNVCRITAWVDTSIGVACNDSTGASSDTAWSLAFDDQATFNGNAGAYLYADTPTATTAYTPASTKTWNSTGGTNTVRKLATGSYEVKLPGFTAADAVPFVTAVGTAATTCHVNTWSRPPGSDLTVAVLCNTPAGIAADSEFALTYTKNN